MNKLISVVLGLTLGTAAFAITPGNSAPVQQQQQQQQQAGGTHYVGTDYDMIGTGSWDTFIAQCGDQKSLLGQQAAIRHLHVACAETSYEFEVTYRPQVQEGRQATRSSHSVLVVGGKGMSDLQQQGDQTSMNLNKISAEYQVPYIQQFQSISKWGLMNVTCKKVAEVMGEGQQAQSQQAQQSQIQQQQQQQQRMQSYVSRDAFCAALKTSTIDGKWSHASTRNAIDKSTLTPALIERQEFPGMKM